MAYVDSQFNTDIQDTVIGGGPASGVALGTVTASATQTYTGTAGSQVNGTYRLPVFKNPFLLKGVRIYTVTAPGGGVTGVNLGFYNGTNLIGSGSVAAAGTYTDITIAAPTLDSHGVGTATTSAPQYFTSTTTNEVVMINTATGTASGSTLGTYSIDFLWRNLFVS